MQWKFIGSRYLNSSYLQTSERHYTIIYQWFANPQVRQVRGEMASFNRILSQHDFCSLTSLTLFYFLSLILWLRVPMAHSFQRMWIRGESFRGVELDRNRVGKPALQWTPAQERQLFRLVAKANVPWKHIANVMYEPAAPGRPEFAPW